MNITLTMSPFDLKTQKQLKFMKSGVGDFTIDIVNRISGYAENQIGLRAKLDVYSYKPKTNSYKRTGRLLGGRTDGMPMKTKISAQKIKIEANPKLRGASFNYAPYVNAGTGWMKKVGKRPFWDNAITKTQKQMPTLIREILENKMK